MASVLCVAAEIGRGLLALRSGGLRSRVMDALPAGQRLPVVDLSCA
jgi:hypothetical protein